MTLGGDPCGGWKVGLHWSAVFQPRDHVEMINGLRLLADPLHWTLLQNATLSAGEQNSRAGIRVVCQRHPLVTAKAAVVRHHPNRTNQRG